MEPKINSKHPHECTCIEEVRNEIDSIDKEIISLLATRLSYVKEVVKYKHHTSSGIEADERRRTVIESRKAWAAEAGLNPDVLGAIYDKLIAYFIEEEKKLVNL